MGHEHFTDLIRRLGRARRRRRREERNFVNTSPGCPFGAVLGERLRELDEGLDEVKGRVNGLIFLVVGVALVDVILRLLTG
jgi:hypothetical protein